MKVFYLSFIVLILTSCYSTVNWPSRYVEEDLTAVTATGDTLSISVHNSYNWYSKNSYYYDGWRFYYNQRWVTPDWYFTNYYIPTYVTRPYPYYYYPQPGIPLKTYPKKSYERRESKPRSTGKTTQQKSRTTPEGKKRTRSSEKSEKG